MERFYNKECDTENLSPLTLAFIGDTVFDLFVREQLICQANRPVNALHTNATRLVKASSQSRVVDKIIDKLSEKELTIYKRGRNAHTNHRAKNASQGDYHRATGLEALFGYLYLKGDIERLRELFSMISERE